MKLTLESNENTPYWRKVTIENNDVCIDEVVVSVKQLLMAAGFSPEGVKEAMGGEEC